MQGSQITDFGLPNESCKTNTATDASVIVPPALPLRVQLEIEDHLAARQPGTSAADPLSLHLCLLRAAIAEGHRERANAHWQKLRSASGKPESWTPDGRFNAGYILLQGVQQGMFTDERVKEATELLISGLGELESGPRENAFALAIDVCRAALYATWCREALRNVQAGVADDFWLPAYLAEMLNAAEASRDDAREALGLLDKVERRLSSLDEAERQLLRAWVDVQRASAHYNLTYYGNTESAQTSALLFRKVLTGSKGTEENWLPREYAWQSLVDLELMAGRIDAADLEFSKWQEEWSRDQRRPRCLRSNFRTLTVEPTH